MDQSTHELIALIKADATGFDSVMAGMRQKLMGLPDAGTHAGEGIGRGLRQAEGGSQALTAGLGNIYSMLTVELVQAAMGFARSMQEMFSEGVAASSALEENLDKVWRMLGSEGAGMIAWAEENARALQLTKGAAIDAIGSMAGNFKAMGENEEASARMAKELTKRAADMASFHNTTVPQALAAISSALRGQQEPLTRYNVQLGDEILGVTSKMSMQEKTAIRLNALWKQTDMQGVIGNLEDTKNSFSNLSKFIEADFRQSVENAGESFKALVSWFRDAGIGNVGMEIKSGLLDVMVAASEAIMENEELIPALAQAWEDLKEVASDFLGQWNEEKTARVLDFFTNLAERVSELTDALRVAGDVYSDFDKQFTEWASKQQEMGRGLGGQPGMPRQGGPAKGQTPGDMLDDLFSDSDMYKALDEKTDKFFARLKEDMGDPAKWDEALNFKDAWNDAIGSISDLFKPLSDGIAEENDNLIDRINGAVDEMVVAYALLGPGLGAVWNTVNFIYSEMGVGTGNLWADISSTWASGTAYVQETTAAWGTDIYNTFMGVKTDSYSTAGAMWTDLTGMFSSARDWLFEWGGRVYDFLTGAWRTTATDSDTIVGSWMDNIGVKFGTMLDNLMNWGLSLFGISRETWDKFVNSGVEALNGFFSRFKTWASGIYDAVITWGAGMIRRMGDIAEAMISPFVGAFNWLIRSFQSFLPQGVDLGMSQIEDKFESTADNFAASIEKMKGSLSGWSDTVIEAFTFENSGAGNFFQRLGAAWQSARGGATYDPIAEGLAEQRAMGRPGGGGAAQAPWVPPDPSGSGAGGKGAKGAKPPAQVGDTGSDSLGEFFYDENGKKIYTSGVGLARQEEENRKKAESASKKGRDAEAQAASAEARLSQVQMTINSAIQSTVQMARRIAGAEIPPIESLKTKLAQIGAVMAESITVVHRVADQTGLLAGILSKEVADTLGAVLGSYDNAIGLLTMLEDVKGPPDPKAMETLELFMTDAMMRAKRLAVVTEEEAAAIDLWSTALQSATAALRGGATADFSNATMQSAADLEIAERNSLGIWMRGERLSRVWRDLGSLFQEDYVASLASFEEALQSSYNILNQGAVADFRAAVAQTAEDIETGVQNSVKIWFGAERLSRVWRGLSDTFRGEYTAAVVGFSEAMQASSAALQAGMGSGWEEVSRIADEKIAVVADNVVRMWLKFAQISRVFRELPSGDQTEIVSEFGAFGSAVEAVIGTIQSILRIPAPPDDLTREWEWLDLAPLFDAGRKLVEKASAIVALWKIEVAPQVALLDSAISDTTSLIESALSVPPAPSPEQRVARWEWMDLVPVLEAAKTFAERVTAAVGAWKGEPSTAVVNLSTVLDDSLGLLESALSVPERAEGFDTNLKAWLAGLGLEGLLDLAAEFAGRVNLFVTGWKVEVNPALASIGEIMGDTGEIMGAGLDLPSPDEWGKTLMAWLEGRNVENMLDLSAEFAGRINEYVQMWSLKINPALGDLAELMGQSGDLLDAADLPDDPGGTLARLHAWLEGWNIENLVSLSGLIASRVRKAAESWNLEVTPNLERFLGSVDTAVSLIDSVSGTPEMGTTLSRLHAWLEGWNIENLVSLSGLIASRVRKAAESWDLEVTPALANLRDTIGVAADMLNAALSIPASPKSGRTEFETWTEEQIDSLIVQVRLFVEKAAEIGSQLGNDALLAAQGAGNTLVSVVDGVLGALDLERALRESAFFRRSASGGSRSLDVYKERLKFALTSLLETLRDAMSGFTVPEGFGTSILTLVNALGPLVDLLERVKGIGSLKGAAEDLAAAVRALDLPGSGGGGPKERRGGGGGGESDSSGGDPGLETMRNIITGLNPGLETMRNIITELVPGLETMRNIITGGGGGGSSEGSNALAVVLAGLPIPLNLVPVINPGGVGGMDPTSNPLAAVLAGLPIPLNLIPVINPGGVGGMDPTGSTGRHIGVPPDLFGSTGRHIGMSGAGTDSPAEALSIMARMATITSESTVLDRPTIIFPAVSAEIDTHIVVNAVIGENGPLIERLVDIIDRRLAERAEMKST